ncbi:gpn-loop gtpase 2 [Anaeramoeba ignava]|uniref:GPN-loop GTPase 2 n=1 Tax=Anaeramoeba ignava TaxID=1746090 RepID=A0A9Q0LQE5_ANAIG|nr:gpn-loop gtpase 2 [Anaeramoeba ignava]
MFAQFVIGPPGSGKTTYCTGMQDILQSLKRNPIVINLDPANENIPYHCDIDIKSLITIEDTMELLELGPNGGLIYCIEYLEKNIDWLLKKLHKMGQNRYAIFDCPGQVELYTHHNSMKNIISELEKNSFKIAVVNLIDAYYCSEPHKFISALLLSLSTMVQLEFPHINILSKIDLIQLYGKLSFNLDFYTNVMDLKYLMKTFDKQNTSKEFQRLNKVLCQLIEDYSLVSFATLNIMDKESVINVLNQIDKANGYSFGLLDENLIVHSEDWDSDKFISLEEKYMRDTNLDNWDLPDDLTKEDKKK